jgi:hypothetical protein
LHFIKNPDLWIIGQSSWLLIFDKIFAYIDTNPGTAFFIYPNPFSDEGRSNRKNAGFLSAVVDWIFFNFVLSTLGYMAIESSQCMVEIMLHYRETRR